MLLFDIVGDLLEGGMDATMCKMFPRLKKNSWVVSAIGIGILLVILIGAVTLNTLGII